MSRIIIGEEAAKSYAKRCQKCGWWYTTINKAHNLCYPCRVKAEEYCNESDGNCYCEGKWEA